MKKLKPAIISALIFGCFLIGCKTDANNESGANRNVKIENAAATAANQNPVNPPANPAPDETDEQKIIDRYLAGVDEVLEGKEIAEFRTIVRGDIDGDGDRRDAAIQFTLEGMGAENAGNYHSLRLAVFRHENGRLKAITDTEIGGRFSRNTDLKKIENGKILFDTKSYAEGDGACCPSIAGKTAYVLKDGELTEVK